MESQLAKHLGCSDFCPDCGQLPISDPAFDFSSLQTPSQGRGSISIRPTKHILLPQNNDKGTHILAALFHMATNTHSRLASIAGKVMFPLGNSSPVLKDIIIFRRGKFLAPDDLCLREMLETQGVFCMADSSKEALLAQNQPSALKLIPESKMKSLPEALGFAELSQKNPGTLYQHTGHSCLLSSTGYQARTVLTLVTASVG